MIHGPISKLDRLRDEFAKAVTARDHQLKSRVEATPAVERKYQDALRRLHEAEDRALRGHTV